MLVLTRRAGERIAIGSDIVVDIFRIHGNHVRVAIEAPEGVAIMRQEVLDRLRQGGEPVGERVSQLMDQQEEGGPQG